MTWRFLYEEALKKQQKKKPAEESEFTVEGSASPGVSDNEQDETYQKKLFENDLYVWSLLLFPRNEGE